MTLEELLKAQGLDEAKVKAVLDGMKENKIYVAGEENLDIRYKKLQEDFATKEREHESATELIKQLKKGTKGDEDLQGKIGEYEAEIAGLQGELEQTKIDSALKVALLEAKVTDVDYLTYKVKEKGEIHLDENGKIKNIEDTITALKTQFPQQFEAGDKKKIDENKLPDGDQRPGVTKAELLKKPYNERLEFYRQNPEQFNEIMKGKGE